MRKNFKTNLFKGSCEISKNITCAEEESIALADLITLCGKFDAGISSDQFISDNLDRIKELPGCSGPRPPMVFRLIENGMFNEAQNIIENLKSGSRTRRFCSAVLSMNLFEQHIKDKNCEEAEEALRRVYPGLQKAQLRDVCKLSEALRQSNRKDKADKLLKEFLGNFAGDKLFRIGYEASIRMIDDDLYDLAEEVIVKLESHEGNDEAISTLLRAYCLVKKGEYYPVRDLDVMPDDSNLNYSAAIQLRIGAILHKNKMTDEADDCFYRAFRYIKYESYRKAGAGLQPMGFTQEEYLIAELLEYRPEYKNYFLTRLSGYLRLSMLFPSVSGISEERNREKAKSLCYLICGAATNLFLHKIYHKTRKEESEILLKTALRFALNLPDLTDYFQNTMDDRASIENLRVPYIQLLDEVITYCYVREDFKTIVRMLPKYESAFRGCSHSDHIDDFTIAGLDLREVFKGLISQTSKSEAKEIMDSFQPVQAKDIAGIVMAEAYAEEKDFNGALAELKTLDSVSFESALIRVMPTIADNIGSESEYKEFVEACGKQSAEVVDCFEAV